MFFQPENSAWARAKINSHLEDVLKEARVLDKYC